MEERNRVARRTIYQTACDAAEGNDLPKRVAFVTVVSPGAHHGRMNTTTEERERTWQMLCHLSALAGFIGVPLGNIIGPLVIWLIKKNEVASVDAHAKEAMNFQISMTIYGVAAGLSIFLLVGIVLLPAVLLADLILIVVASVKASNGELFRYPLTIRFI